MEIGQCLVRGLVQRPSQFLQLLPGLIRVGRTKPLPSFNTGRTITAKLIDVLIIKGFYPVYSTCGMRSYIELAVVNTDQSSFRGDWILTHGQNCDPLTLIGSRPAIQLEKRRQSCMGLQDAIELESLRLVGRDSIHSLYKHRASK